MWNGTVYAILMSMKMPNILLERNVMKPQRLILYTICHFLVDWACIFLVTGALRQVVPTREGWLWLIMTYNACAFALQLPLGILADRIGQGWRTAALGAVLVAAGIMCIPVPLLACVIAGVGNALFHLGGGREVLLLSGARAGPSGVFVASGAVGVWLGVFCARTGAVSSLIPVPVMLCAAFLLNCLGRREADASRTWSRDMAAVSLLGAGLLTLTIVLRSWVGTQMSFPWKTGMWGLAVVLAVAAGKALGGLLGDRFRWSRTGLLTLLLAAACFLPSFRYSGAGIAAAILFNTTMSITLAALARTFGSEHCGMAFGLTTFALFLGLIPDLLQFPDWGASPQGLCVSCLVSAVLLTSGLMLTKTAEMGRDSP